MIFGIIVVLALFASAFAAHFLLADPGYVIINFRGYVVEMSVPVLLGLAIALLIAIWLIRKIILAPRRLGEAAGRYRSARSGQKMTRGMIAVAEGNFSRGEKLLARAAGSSDSPLFNYLQAARAAHLQGRDDRRDEWLRLAYKDTPEAANAVLLTQAEFQLDRGQNEQALATLRQLDENSKDHAHALSLLGRLYFELQDWASLAELLPRLRKNTQIKPETLDTWTIRVQKEALDVAADDAALAQAWKQVSRPLKSNATLLEAYYAGLLRIGEHERAEKELASVLKSNWQGPLVRLFGLVQSSDTSKQLKRAEGWLKNHGDDPDLLLAAARLCLKNELWGKAR
ncbi:MAG: heme biosynthesis protein HemY, partial [Woeseiaceae bacterium]|nr:heme biosynthesis protein HemY [Woeseiaceae bacterium]